MMSSLLPLEHEYVVRLFCDLDWEAIVQNKVHDRENSEGRVRDRPMWLVLSMWGLSQATRRKPGASDVTGEGFCCIALLGPSMSWTHVQCWLDSSHIASKLPGFEANADSTAGRQSPTFLTALGSRQVTWTSLVGQWPWLLRCLPATWGEVSTEVVPPKWPYIISHSQGTCYRRRLPPWLYPGCQCCKDYRLASQ